MSRNRRADVPFPDALQALLESSTAAAALTPTASRGSRERATLNALANRVGVRQSHLWRIVHQPDERRASLELIAKVAIVLGLPPDYFLETRAAAVEDYLRCHPARLNRLYSEACRSDARDRPDPV